MKIKTLLSLPIMEIAMISSSSANTSDMPSIKKMEVYSLVRETMINAGWSPYHAPGALTCSVTDERCKGRPEMEACSDVGLGQCGWLWKKSGHLLLINTVSGGEDELFVSMDIIR